MRVRPVMLLALLALSALTLAGCDKIEEAIKPSKPAVRRVTIEAKIGVPDAALRSPLKDPAPAGVPLWEGAGIARNKVTKSSSGTSWFATLTTKDKYSDVAKGMAVGFQKAGWAVQLQDVSATDASSTVLAVSGSSGSGVVTITETKNSLTQINYVITTDD